MDSFAFMVKESKISACFSLVPKHLLGAMWSSAFKLQVAYLTEV